jgi:reverse transcriptase-like protein
VADKVVQAALKLVLEPIFEADFEPVSYGFRPMRRAHDAIAEIHYFGTRGYRWVLDADIEAAFDNLSHCAVLERVRARVKDKRVLALVKAFAVGRDRRTEHFQDTEGRAPTRSRTPRPAVAASCRQPRPAVRRQDTRSAVSSAQGQDRVRRQDATSLREGSCGSPEDNLADAHGLEPLARTNPGGSVRRGPRAWTRCGRGRA